MSQTNRTHRMRVFLSTVLLFTMLFSSGCSIDDLIHQIIPDTTTKTLGVINDAINALGNTSADWQMVLQNTVSKLTDSAQSTIRNEVNDLLSRSVATVGTEFRCNADFIKNRVQQGLERIRAEVLNVPVEAREPVFCDAVPAAVDISLIPQNRLKTLDFYGYDFDTTPVQVLLQNTSNTVDVSSSLARPTHYHMTLNLGSNGVPLTAQSQRLILKWQNKEISSLSIVQPQTPVCQISTPPARPVGNITFKPPRTRGDADFAGHGPEIWASVGLVKYDDHIDAVVSMTARETQDDWTTASGSQTTRIYTADPGFRIEQIIGAPSDSYHYIHDGHNIQAVERGAGGPVSRYEFVGDTDGDEAGTRTQVTVHFNPLRVQLIQNQNCVSPNAVKNLQSITRDHPELQLLSPELNDRLKQELKALPSQ